LADRRSRIEEAGLTPEGLTTSVMLSDKRVPVNARKRVSDRWVAASRPVGTLGALQAQLDEFRSYYDQIRPHRAIDRDPPSPPTKPGPRRSLTTDP
jgi:hypothetical protein